MAGDRARRKEAGLEARKWACREDLGQVAKGSIRREEPEGEVRQDDQSLKGEGGAWKPGQALKGRGRIWREEEGLEARDRAWMPGWAQECVAKHPGCPTPAPSSHQSPPSRVPTVQKRRKGVSKRERQKQLLSWAQDVADTEGIEGKDI